MRASMRDPTPFLPADVPPTRDHPCTVLVVDDRAADQDLHCLLLRRLGMRAIAAGDGWEALAYTRSVRLHLVVADLDMPRLDGWGLLARLRAAPDTARLPVLLVTAHADRVSAERARAAGAAAMLGKPLDVRAFGDALARLLAPPR